MASVTKLQQAAIGYVRHGFPVFPLRARSKKPITEHGFQDASRDSAQVDAWWTQHPQANIGIPMGAASELLLLDLDYRNGSVIESRADLIELYGEIPDTCEVITGSGGRHIYFHFQGGPVPKEIGKGIELKSDGGYAVVPPSIHPNGKPYAFDGAAGWKALLKVADPPQWLLEAIAFVIPDDESIKVLRRRRGTRDDQLLPLINSHPLPRAGTLARFILAIPPFRD